MFSVNGSVPLLEYGFTLFLLFLAGWAIARHYGVLWALSLSWMAFSAIRIFGNVDNPFADSARLWIESLNGSASATLASILLALIAVEAFKVQRWLYLFQYVILANAVLLLSPFTGLCLNPSMSGCLNACALPIFFDRRGRVPVLSLILIVASILASGQSQPLALLFIAIGIQFIRKKRFKHLFLAALLSVGAGYLISGRMLFDSSGRVELWTLSLRFWKETFNPWIGAGLGTYYVFGPALTIGRAGFDQGYLWLHSEVLQVLFEQGIIGLVLTGFAYTHTVIVSKRDTRAFTALVLYGCFCLANFPFHSPVSAFFGLILIKWALQLPTETLPVKTSRHHSNCQE